MNANRRRRMQAHVERLGNPDWKISGRAEDLLLRHYITDVFEAALAGCVSPAPHIRFRAVWILAHTKDPRAYKTIERLTRDPDERVRYDAAVALGRLGDLRAVPYLIGLLGSLEDTTPVGDALYRLGPDVVPFLAPLVHSTKLNVRYTAMNAIGHLALDTNRPELLELIRSCRQDPDASLRSDCEGWFREAEAAFHGSSGRP